MKTKIIGILLLFLLLAGCKPKSDVNGLTDQINNVINELDQMAAGLNTAIKVNNMESVRDMVPKYAAKAEEFNQLTEKYMGMVKPDDAQAKPNLDLINRERATLKSNINILIDELKQHQDLVNDLKKVNLNY